MKWILWRHNLGGKTGCRCVWHANQRSKLKNPSLFNFRVLDLSKHYQTQVLHPYMICHHNENSTFTTFTAPQEYNFANPSRSFTNRACKGCKSHLQHWLWSQAANNYTLVCSIQLSLSLDLIYVPVSAELQPRYALNKNVFK